MRLRFDRGTLLLEDPPDTLDVAELPGVLWDPRVRVHRALACRYRSLAADLARRAIAFRDEAREECPAPLGWRSIALRPYQEAALLAWELAGRRGIVALPTGSGKTRVALAVMARCGLRALCLVPTRALLAQWREQIATHYPGPVGLLGDGNREIAPVTVATFESGYRHMERLGNRFDLLIVDEVHHFGCGIRDEALEMTTADARLGLTATPPREEPAAERLAQLVGPIVYELAIGDLAGRFLASFESITLRLDLDPEERRAYECEMNVFRAVHERFRRLAPEAGWVDFARAAARTSEGRRALDAWRRARRLVAYTRGKRAAVRSLLGRHGDARVLVFTADNETAYAVAREHLVMPITCDIDRREREAALARFRVGELRALVSARVLNEGIDVPDADVAVVVGGTLGEREHVQRVGRLLRPAPGKRAVVYELVARATLEVRQARRRGAGLAARAVDSL